MAERQSNGVLLTAAKRGDAAAFDALVSPHVRTTFLVALAYVGNADAAEDVAQDALVRAWTMIGRCRAPDRFGAWLNTIVRRTALNTLNKDKRRRHLLTRLFTEASAGEDVARVAAPNVRTELSHAIATALASLAPRQREILLLHDVEERRHDDIADLLEITPATSRKYLSEARARMKEQLAPRKEPAR